MLTMASGSQGANHPSAILAVLRFAVFIASLGASSAPRTTSARCRAALGPTGASTAHALSSDLVI